ncbi:MAG TPA: hypothetical protein VFG87_25335 [Amycolatopsis sp.]|jgi:hypothetical protein|nr:hypothetical protein [Amycolatopsis sp.]
MTNPGGLSVGTAGLGNASNIFMEYGQQINSIASQAVTEASGMQFQGDQAQIFQNALQTWEGYLNQVLSALSSMATLIGSNSKTYLGASNNNTETARSYGQSIPATPAIPNLPGFSS